MHYPVHDFWMPLKKYGELVMDKQLSSGYNTPTLYEIYKRGRVVLSKHVTHYGPLSGFPYIAWQPLPIDRASPIHHPGEICGFEPW
jgi:hypothetical protein